MVDSYINTTAIHDHYSNISTKEILEFLDANDFASIQESSRLALREQLVEMICDHDAFDCNDKRLTIEHDNPSCFHIDFMGILESASRRELVDLLTDFVRKTITGDSYDRVLELRSTAFDMFSQDKFTRRYHLASILSYTLNKNSSELIYGKSPNVISTIFKEDGNLSQQEL
jgi:hypothetical protein